MSTEPTPDAPVDLTSAPADESAAKVAKLEAQLHDYKLLVADLQTSARRLNEDAAKQRKYFAEPLALDVLGLLDNLERATEAAKQKGEGGILLDGVAKTIQAALEMLKRHAVQRIVVDTGAAFDPNLHMAVSQQPSADHPPGVVVGVLQQGFTLHDRVLRPAAVIVSSEG
ncbi:MAG: nucleotide exchange factor GrpE [Fimbriiglobus sp.]|jgi:molecular chaperone GrpE|nr:nucleotide exchange factor GrpE [Fimbriiglobus sp.]